MLKKTITFENVDGEEVTEDFYFNMNKAEMLEMELTVGGDDGLEEHFKKVVASGNRQAILDIYKEILSRTVGRREGKLFIKNDQITNEFMHGGAYSQMFMDLFNNPNAILEFFRGVLPNNMKAGYDTIMKEQLGTEAPAQPEVKPEPEFPSGKVASALQVELPPGGTGEVVHTDAEPIPGLDDAAEARLLDAIFGKEEPVKPK